MDQDEQHLQILSILHYLLAAVIALFACFPVLHLIIGIIFLAAPEAFEGPNGFGPPPMLFGLLFTIVPAAIILAGWTLAICVFLGGRFIARRTHYTWCLVVAGISCIFMPLGTLLGVFTIVVLLRPSVKAMFLGQEGNYSLPQQQQACMAANSSKGRRKL